MLNLKLDNLVMWHSVLMHLQERNNNNILLGQLGK